MKFACHKNGYTRRDVIELRIIRILRFLRLVPSRILMGWATRINRQRFVRVYGYNPPDEGGRL